MLNIQHEQSRENVGEIVRQWRKARRISQMELAFEARVSTRHLSFVETGRATPSQDLLLRLADALQLPLRHTNNLLLAGGYAPQYSDWSLEEDHSGVIREALERMLAQHAPFPAVVTNQSYDVVMVNAGFRRLAQWLNPAVDLLAKYPNVFRLIFAAEGARDAIVNWQEFAPLMLKRLYDESVLYHNKRLAQLHTECTAIYSAGHDTDATTPTAPEPQLPIATLTLYRNATELSFFSTVTAFGTPIDVTLQELRIENLFPADDATRDFFLNNDHASG
jgi:transcriptional regulator with XRE-family HTH domain